MKSRLSNRALAWLRPLLLILFLSSCATDSVVRSPVPTLTLIPATATPTATPILPTETLPPRISPNDLLTTATPVSVNAIQELVDRALDDLVQDAGVPADSVTLVELYSATWTTPDYGCGEERLSGAALSVDGYRMVFDVEGEDVAYHTDSLTTIRRCAEANRVVGELAVYLEADPIGAELAALARQRVMRLEAIEADAVQLVKMRPYVWTDTAWGCPLPDTEYTPTVTNGYQLIFATATAEYIFHTGVEQVRLCDAENVRLP